MPPTVFACCHQRQLRLMTVVCLIASSVSFTTSLPNPIQNNHKRTLVTSSLKIPTKTTGNALKKRWNGQESKLNSSSDDTEDTNDIDDVITIRGGASPPPPPPTLKQIITFALPCLGLWISGPLLSLVDTASVGLTAKPGMGAIQLGALGPATTFIDGATYLFAFLNVATTNLYASAMAASQTDDEQARKAAGDPVARTAVKNSLFCGFGLMALLLATNRRLLSLYVGETAAAKVLEPASDYVMIRALSMPTSLLAGVLQAALLGAKDSVTPLYAVAASTVVNVFGDLMCVVALGMGCRGAAIATLFAQWAGTLSLWRPAQKKLFVPPPKDGSKRPKISSGRFLSFAAPVLTLILGKLVAFGFMTHVAASLPDPSALASHQLVLSLFFFVSPFLEVISQTAQTFLPQYYIGIKDKVYGDDYASSAQNLAARLLKFGLSVGAIVALVASTIPRFLPFLLTNDAGVQSCVKPLALPLLVGSILTAPVAVSEGVLLARRELKYLAGVYLLSTAVFPFFLLKIKASAGPVVNIWWGFALFQLFRALCFTGRLWGGVLIDRLGLGGKGKKVAEA